MQGTVSREEATVGVTPTISDRLSIVAHLEQTKTIVPDMPEELETLEQEPPQTVTEITVLL